MEGIAFYTISGSGGSGPLWSIIKPKNFHFYSIFGHFFASAGFHPVKVFRKLSENFRKIQKSTKIRSKTHFRSNLDRNLAFLPNQTVFRANPPVYPNFDAFGAKIGGFLDAFGGLSVESPLLYLCSGY